MVENLSKHYGDQICETDFGDNAADPTPFHSFPTVDALAANPSPLEKRLRSLGFGYRAGYIAKTATALQKKGGRDFLLKLREADYEDAREELLELSGIGPKVHIRYHPEKNRKKINFPGCGLHLTHVFGQALLHSRGHAHVPDRCFQVPPAP